MPRARFHPLSIALRLAVAYAVICVFMALAQRHILYIPKLGIRSPAEYGLTHFEALRLETADGLTVEAWYHPAARGFPTLVYFHGNGGNLGTRTHYFTLLSNAGYGILGLDYRGYGASEGTPTEQGFYLDARATLAYATTRLGLKPGALILYGESLGTGVAVQMATEFPSAAVVLQSPYTSIDALAEHNYPWLPVRVLMRDHFDSLDKITRIRAPLLLFHGEEDRVVPVRLGKILFAKANPPKKALFLPHTGHGDFDLAFLTQALTEFCTQQNIIR